MVRMILPALSLLLVLPLAGSTAPPADVLVPGLDAPRVKPRASFRLQANRMQDGTAYLSADGSVLAVGAVGKDDSARSAVQIWDVAGKTPKLRSGFGEGLSCFALSPSGRRLLTVEKHEVFDTTSKKVVAKLTEDFSHAFFVDDATVVTAKRSYDFSRPGAGAVYVWDLKKPGKPAAIWASDNRFDLMLPAKGGREAWLFLSSDKYQIECFDVPTRKLVRTITPKTPAPVEPFKSVGLYHSIAGDGDTFASAHTFGTFVFDGDGGAVATVPKDLWGGHRALVAGRSWYLARPSIKGAKAAGLRENDRVVYDWKAGKVVAVLTGHAADQKSPAVTTSADGKVLVSIGEQGEGLVFDLNLDGPEKK